MSKLRVLLADDHGVLRAGLRALLDEQPDLEVVGEAETADAMLDMVRDLAPDVAVVDVRMPGDGLVATQRIRKDPGGPAVLILSQYDDPAYLDRAMAAGASGYALKRASGQELVEAIRTVARGEVYLHPAMVRVLVEHNWGPRQPSQPSSPANLSERESQVLRLVALGHTTQQIAELLYLSIRTIETYKVRGMEKLGLKGRASLVHYALEHGLLGTEAEQ